MRLTYTVRAIDNLASIAKRHGYGDWREIYFHPDNAAFRTKRPNPEEIWVGDVLVLPDRQRRARA